MKGRIIFGGIKVRIIKSLPRDAECVGVHDFYRVYHSKSCSSRVYYLWNDGTVESF